MGKEAVRKGLVEGGGAKVVGAEWESGEGGRSTGLVNSVMVCFFFLRMTISSGAHLRFVFLGCSAGASAGCGYE